MNRMLPALAFVMMIHAPTALAQDTTAAAPPPVPCSSPENRQFDFWIGSWNVENPAGEYVGTNEIAAILGGCALEESWRGKSGFTGKSLNMYDALDGRWHQTWIDSSGSLLKLAGGLSGGAMVLAGEQPSTVKPGSMVRHRITWTPLEGGRVRQHWESSTDDGATWTTAFDGLYVRKG